MTTIASVAPTATTNLVTYQQSEGIAAGFIGTNAVVSTDATHTLSGNNALKVVWGGLAGDSHVEGDGLSLLPSTTYTFQLRVYSELDTYLQELGSYIQENRGAYRGVANLGSGVTFIPANTWVYLTGTGTTFSDWDPTSRIILRPASDSAGNFVSNPLWYDVIQVEQNGIASSWTPGLTTRPAGSLLLTGEVIEGYRQLILRDRPAAYYRMDETSGTTAFDSSGNGNNGTITGGVTLNQPGALVDGDAAMAFDGSTGYVQIASSATPAGNAFTVEAIVRSTNQGTDLTIMCQEPVFEIALAGDGSAGRFSCALMTSNMNGKVPPTWYWFGGGPNLSDGAWHHVIAAYDGAEVNLYADGVLVHTEPNYSGGLQLDGNPISIGCRGLGTTGAQLFFPGTLDEVAIYPYALTPAQIQEHYQMGTQKFGISPAGNLLLATGELEEVQALPASTAMRTDSVINVLLAGEIQEGAVL
ncbi:MAG: LamG domain-containing protein [Patescibacteria group bacterium]|nr:LamG domain-containing protein [Patescibacteria group bacterium]